MDYLTHVLYISSIELNDVGPELVKSSTEISPISET